MTEPSSIPDRGVWARIFDPGPTVPSVPLAATGRAGRNLPAATATSVVLIGAVALSLAFLPQAFVALVALLCLGGCWEMAGALRRVDIRVAVAPLYVGTIGIIVSAWAAGAEAAFAALFLTVLVVAIWVVTTPDRRSSVTDLAASVFTAVYVPFLAAFVVLILREHGIAVLGTYVLVTVLNDLGGWCAGILFGRHPMAPRLSPKKSWEGFAGSVLACVVGGLVCFHLLGAHWWWGLIAGVLACVVGTFGDLTESLVKREVGLKDMSSLLPGHGGVLDRVDALLMVAPVMHLIVAFALEV